MNPILKAGLKYFLIFILLFSCLTAISLIPQVGNICNKIYRNPTEKILATIYPSVFFKLKGDPNNPDLISIEYVAKKKIAEIRQLNRTGARNKSLQIPSKIYDVKFYNAFLSFYVFFVTLMVLSPLPWKDILIGLGIGSILFYLYSVFKISLKLLIFFNQSESPIYQTNPSLLKFTEGLLYIQTLGTTVLVVIILWVFLAFRKTNWKDLLKVDKQ